jgi:hypothetical protein
MSSFLTDFRESIHKFRENPSSGNDADYAKIVGQTDSFLERHFSLFFAVMFTRLEKKIAFSS